MQPLRIPCPKCGKELKLKDRSLLGRKGKCPGCEHRFILTDPDEVELQLADAVVGTAAKWVPDEPQQPAAAGWTPDAAPAQAVQTPPAGLPVVETGLGVAVEEGGAARLKELKRKRAKQRKVTLIAGSAVGAVLACVVGWIAFSGMGDKKADDDGKSKTPVQIAKSYEGEKKERQENLVKADADKPPAGEPVDLKFVPFGTNIVVHLRPAELWQQNSVGETVRFCLGPLGTWTEAKIKELCLFEPAEIEDVLFCLILQTQDEPPQISYVVQLKKQVAKSAFLKKFRGEVDDTTFGKVIYRNKTSARAYMITDGKGQAFASVPDNDELIKDMVSASNNALAPAGGIEQVLKHTNRKHHVTMIFEPKDIRVFKQQLAAKEAHTLIDLFLDRFTDNRIETVAWSFYFGDDTYDRFYSQLVLRNRTETIPNLLAQYMVGGPSRAGEPGVLEGLPDELLGAIRKMDPKTIGPRKLIGRLPIMAKAFYVETRDAIGSKNDRFVQLTTVLPKVAGPNLAAASLLAWNESLTTDFTKEPVTPVGPSSNVPKTISARLKQRIDIDFRRTPLQDALNYIGEETKVKVEINGDALKDSGYTKNMAQSFSLGSVPANTALAKIVGQYKQMVLVVDETKKVLIVTTKKFAAKNGQKPYKIPQ